MSGPGSPTTARPGPVGRNEASAAFFDGTAEGRFLLNRCDHGHWNRPQAEVCVECRSTVMHLEPSSGRARLVSWVVVHPRPGADGSTPGPPAVPAIVELEEGPWWWTQLVDVDLDGLGDGTALQVFFERPEGSEAVPAFTTAAAEALLTGRLVPLPLVSDLSVETAAGGAGEGGTVVAPDRHITFDGPVNFRDIGGYPAAGGRTVRWGRVYRSDTLVLSDGDVERFQTLGIRHVYDMRNEVERRATPNRLPERDGPAVELVPLVSDDPADNPLASIGRAGAADFLRLLYLHILERSAPAVGRILTGLASEPDLPAVFHCSAGKDRTGLITAVLLSVLGVPREVIVDDYELTGRYRTTEHVQATVTRIGEAQNLAPEVVAGMLEAPRSAMESALTEIGDRFGGFDRYLTEPAGGAPELPDRLRRTLLTP